MLSLMLKTKEQLTLVTVEAILAQDCRLARFINNYKYFIYCSNRIYRQARTGRASGNIHQHACLDGINNPPHPIYLIRLIYLFPITHNCIQIWSESFPRDLIQMSIFTPVAHRIIPDNIRGSLCAAIYTFTTVKVRLLCQKLSPIKTSALGGSHPLFC